MIAVRTLHHASQPQSTLALVVVEGMYLFTDFITLRILTCPGLQCGRLFKNIHPMIELLDSVINRRTANVRGSQFIDTCIYHIRPNCCIIKATGILYL